ncbi:MAG TPA: F0F1 ATP synthase subunit A [Nitrospinota bacterium]|nr:F0F1 ATP synthase subunit A [Nitrospinota bacterium]|tara:strand:- start:26207 stop:26869 length:663 start_codon:yes stop_codon:yes gene_type:complete
MKEPINYLVLPGLEHYPHVTYTWVIMIGFFIIAMLLRGTFKMIPNGMQNALEMIVWELAQFVDSILGKDGRKFFPFIGALAFFILCANLIGLIPGCVPPTANVNTNIAMAIMVFIVYQAVGFSRHGLGYIKHFMGPVWWMVPLMFPIEIISHLARPLTLAVRLFGNIKGEELVILVLGFLIPLILPMPMIAFAIFTSILQTLVFILLSLVYIAGALEEAH